MTGLQDAFAALLIATAGVLWKGIAIGTLWNWFVVPIARVRRIAVSEAIGLCILIAAFTYNPNQSYSGPRPLQEDFALTLKYGIALLILLGMGALMNWLSIRSRRRRGIQVYP